MTTNDIDAIRKLTDDATPGPWVVGEAQCTDEIDAWEVPLHAEGPVADLAVLRYQTNGFQFPHAEVRADADFIAAARTHVPALCDEVEQLRAELADVRAKFQDALWTASQHADTAKQLTAERDAARDMANTARNETAQALHALDHANTENERLRNALLDVAKSSGKTHVWDHQEKDWVPVVQFATRKTTALPTAGGDDKPCCGYGCNDNLTGATR